MTYSINVFCIRSFVFAHRYVYQADPTNRSICGNGSSRMMSTRSTILVAVSLDQVIKDENLNILYLLKPSIIRDKEVRTINDSSR
ncbi:MAG: hypothetical protein XE11_0606 [Methanomicrobiales archaeon 53_19]|nr:MAG: hypothetical protein XD88_1612 [Methanocalculus sp. 52_23]KUL04354.1 MAG: hypothetical protein XE11_0606 [Methanomicrobiales archaeon 53_19]